MQQEDSLLVALAGHGVQSRGETGSDFCPSDANLDDRELVERPIGARRDRDLDRPQRDNAGLVRGPSGRRSATKAKAMSGDTAEDRWLANLTYRGAYGIASELWVEHRQSPDWQNDPTRWMIRETIQEMTPFGQEPDLAVVELIREAVGDVLAKRRPRW